MSKLSRSKLDPETMIELNLSDDLYQTILKAFDEMRAEAQIAPIVLTFPPEVIERAAAYAKDHSMEANAYAPNRYNYLDSNH